MPIDNVGKVSLEDLPRLGEGHRRVCSELLLRPLSVTPLLRHPVGGHPLRHRFENENQAAGSTAFAIGQILLLLVVLHALQRLFDSGIGQARHGVSLLGNWDRSRK
jgi:hypothetical protein